MMRSRWKALVAGAGALLYGAGAAHAQVVINEVDYDQPGADTGEFLELLNTGASAVDLSTYAVRLINGSNGTDYSTTALSGLLPAGGYLVLCPGDSLLANCDAALSGNSIQNGAPDGVVLEDGGVIVDSLSYEGDMSGVTEGSGAGTDSADDALSRCPDGTDTDNNAADFALAAPTPGAANACGSAPGCNADADCGAGELCVAGACEVASAFGACGDAATMIHDVQGSGSSSPIEGQVVVIEGVVVGDFQDAQIGGVFIQEEDADADADASTSEGIFVYNVNTPVNAGDVVRVQGEVAEFSSLTELTNVSQVAVCPQSGAVTATSVTFPVTAVDTLEALEGMLTTFPQTLTVTETFNLGRYGSLSLSAPGRLYQPTHVAEPGPAALAVDALNDRSRIELDDLSTSQNPNPIPYKNAQNTRRVGDTVDGLMGILSGRFGTYRVQPTAPVIFADSNPRPAAPPAVGDDLKVVSFNVLNFFTTLDQGGALCGPSNLGCRGADSQTEYDRQLAKLLNALELLDGDIIGLNELENNDSQSLQALVDGLNVRVGAGTYDFVNSGALGTDAIKVGMLYKTTTVALAGSSALLDASVDPTFVDTKNRPVLAQTFDAVSNGGRVTVAVAHLKSKGSDCDDLGDPDLGDGSGNCNGTRTAAAQAIVNWLATDPTQSGDSDFLVVGDFNAYAKESPIDAMKAGGYEELIDTFVGNGESSYIFFGESGYLDYGFASAALSSQVTDVAVWHHNADEPSAWDYNLEFKTDDPFDIADPFRASDHDSLIIGLNLSGAVVDPNAPLCNGLPATIYVHDGTIVGGPWAGRPYKGALRGTQGDDVIAGTREADRIRGGGGNDVICAGNGDDRVRGGDGDDTLLGGGGNDDLRGGNGDDFLDGGTQNDKLRGGNGNDQLMGGGGDDDLRGGDGDDSLSGGPNQDRCFGNRGNGDNADATCEFVRSVP